MTGDKKRYLLICNTADGLIAQLNGVVVQLQLARRLGLEPIVYLPARSYMFGGPNPYFEESSGPNVWEYYFEPIGPSFAEWRGLISDGRVLTLASASELTRLFRWEPESWMMNPYGYARSVENHADGPYPARWWLEQREKARTFFEDGTIRFKRALVDQVQKFVDDNFTPRTLGIQLRGSDKFDFGVGPNLSRKVLPEEYFPHIDRYLAGGDETTRVFVATDQRQWLKALEEAYPGRILSFSEQSLSDSNANLFHASHQKAGRGAEVIVDALLLSQCSYLIKCHAGVGEFALVLSPDLDFIDLNYADQPFEARRRPLHGAISPAIAALCSIWTKLGESGLSLAKVTSVDAGEVFVTGGGSLASKVSASEKAPAAPIFSKRFASDAAAWALRSLAGSCFEYGAHQRRRSADAIVRAQQGKRGHFQRGRYSSQLVEYLKSAPRFSGDGETP